MNTSTPSTTTSIATTTAARRRDPLRGNAVRDLSRVLLDASPSTSRQRERAAAYGRRIDALVASGHYRLHPSR